MSPINLLKSIGEMGGRYKVSELHLIMDYATRMLEDKRVVLINLDEKPYACLFFSLTNLESSHLVKGTWDYISHDPDGKYLYVEKLIATKWSKTLRLRFEEEIIKTYPQITHGVWHRWATYGDRIVKSKRRVNNE